jgi:hypothetical protein
MILVNFSHPVTPEQLRQIASLAGAEVERVIELPARFDDAAPYAGQARSLIESAGLSGSDWQTLPLVFILPSLSAIAALVLAELHGRMGYFPAALRLRPASTGPVRGYEVAEILDLQAARDDARRLRDS